MPKTLSKRAIEGRKWRIAAREKRRINTVIAEYVRVKHEGIYVKCTEFYNRVVDEYPQAQNLIKMQEFREMLEKETATASEQTHETATTSEQTHETATASEQTHETATTSEQTHETATTSEQTHETATASEQTHETETTTVTIGNTYVEPGLIMNEYIITEAMNGTIGDIIDDGIDRVEDMETVVNNIIRDLEDVEPAIFESIEDEGIGLNTEDEVGNLLHDFDIDVDIHNLW